MAMIKVAFSRSTLPYAIGSEIIQAAEKRPYSHAFVMFYDPFSEQTLIFQASHGMVHLVPLDRFSKENRIVKSYDLDVTDAECQRVWKFMVSKLGIPYSRRELIIIAIMKMLGLKRFLKVDGDKSYICSALAAEFCKLECIQIPEYTDVITPSDLDTLLGSTDLPCEIYEPNL